MFHVKHAAWVGSAFNLLSRRATRKSLSFHVKHAERRFRPHAPDRAMPGPRPVVLRCLHTAGFARRDTDRVSGARIKLFSRQAAMRPCMFHVKQSRVVSVLFGVFSERLQERPVMFHVKHAPAPDIALPTWRATPVIRRRNAARRRNDSGETPSRRAKRCRIGASTE